MKLILSVILCLLLAADVDARTSGVSLNEAVNEVKSQGRILSAKTISGIHEIKVLTPSGTVKTIKRSAGKQPSKLTQKDGSSYQQRRDWSTDFEKENNFEDLRRQRGYPSTTQKNSNRNSSQRRQSNNRSNDRPNNRSNQGNRNQPRPQKKQNSNNNNRDKNK